MIKSAPRASLPVKGGSQLCSQQRKGVHSLHSPFFLFEWMLPRLAPACDADGAPVCVFLLGLWVDEGLF